MTLSANSRVFVTTMFLISSLFLPSNSASALNPGGSCPRAGQVRVVKTISFRCTKISGNRKVWRVISTRKGTVTPTSTSVQNDASSGSSSTPAPTTLPKMLTSTTSVLKTTPTTTTTTTTTTPTTTTTTTPTTTTTTTPTTTTTTSPTAASCRIGGVCSVGDTGPGGGIVFYVASGSFSSLYDWSSCRSSCRYLEAAPAGWYDGGDDPLLAIGVAGGAWTIGSGGSNRDLINFYNNDPNGAMAIVSNYQGGGKNDWFIPSKDELNEMYKSKSVIPGLLTSYLSSTLKESTYVYTQIFNYRLFQGSINWAHLNTNIYVRPVRAF